MQVNLHKLTEMTQEQEQLTLIKLRDRAGLTQRELAQALGVTITTVSAWENKRHEPRLTFAQTKLLTQILGCTLDELVEATMERSQEK